MQWHWKRHYKILRLQDTTNLFHTPKQQSRLIINNYSVTIFKDVLLTFLSDFYTFVYQNRIWDFYECHMRDRAKLTNKTSD